MDFKTLQELDTEYVAGTYARNPVDVWAGEGVDCRNVEGGRYIDFSSGIGVNALGFTNPAWVTAVKGQLDRLAHISNLYYTQPQAELAAMLCKRTGMRKVFFANSGAEANEGAIKTARKYMHDHYGDKRNTIVTLENSFHGRTIATLTATGQDGFHKHFGPFPEGFSYAKPNDIDDLLAKLTDDVGAIMIECVQGEGGVVPLDEAFLNTIQSVCSERDLILIVDEIQTGTGRTGKFLCLEHFGLKPDVVTLAKGLGGGLPIGAVLFGEKTGDTLGKGDHGSTFGGNPVCCAGAIAVLNTLDQEFLDHVIHTGEYLRENLLKLPGISGVTGRGLMLGAELSGDAQAGDVVRACGEQGLILLTAKQKIRFLPPLTITNAEIDEGLKILEKVLSGIQGKGGQQ